jgi:hypothetical protein
MKGRSGLKSTRQIFVAVELVLLFPALLFLAAVGLRFFQSVRFEPAHTAQVIVNWYAGRIWTLWVLLVALPLAALVMGCIALQQGWTKQKPSGPVRCQRADWIITVETLVAALILVVVGMHVLAN